MIQCCENTIKISIFVSILIFGIPSIFLLALGKSILDEIITISSITAIILTLPFIPVFLQFPKCDKCRWKYHIFCCDMRYKKYLTMIIMYFFTCFLIILAHIIGYPIIKNLYHTDNFFTSQTCVAGYSIYAVVASFVAVILFGYYYEKHRPNEEKQQLLFEDE